MQGLKHVVNDMDHRKEFIAGNLAEYTTTGRSTASSSSYMFLVLKLLSIQNSKKQCGVWVMMPAIFGISGVL